MVLCNCFFFKCNTEIFFKHLVYFELVFKINFVLVSIKLISFDLYFIGFFYQPNFFKMQTILLFIE